MVTADPAEALRLVQEYKPHLVLLDLVLPGTDGIDLMKDIAETRDVPVIFLSAYGQDKLVARAFDMGAADYVVKPFSPTELLARIRAALRRREVPKPSEPYVLGDLTIDYDERRVTLAGRPVELTAKEYGTLAELSTNAGPRADLRDSVAPGLGARRRRRHSPYADHDKQHPSQAGRRRREPHLRLH